MKETTYVAISTQKGGAGKTTLTVLVASYLHYVKGYNVAVVDCDFPQYSIHDMRKRDLKAVMEDGHYKVMAYEQLKRLKKNPYTIRCSRAEDAIRTAENLTEAQPDLDFVFFDLPGTINNADVVQTIAKMDYIFTPIIADRVVMESSIKFATVINEQMISTGNPASKESTLCGTWWTDARRRNYTRHTTRYAPSSPCLSSKHSCRTASVSARKQRRSARRCSVPRRSLRTRHWYAAATLTALWMKFSVSSKIECHGKESKNRGHRQ